MFDEAAERGTRLVDAQLAMGTYHRARVLVEAVDRATPHGGRILDYGCGAGRISLLMAKRGFSVLGVEPSQTLIRLATAQDAVGLSLDFWCIDPSETGSLDAQSFDTILCSSVIEFISDPVDLLRGLRQLLRPEGRLLISYASRTSLWRQYAEWRFGRSERHFGRQQHVWHESKAWEVLAKSGFEKAGATRFFESPFDRYDPLRPLSRFRIFGTLGLVIAGRGSGR